MLAFMKIDCLVSNCCIGKHLPSIGIQFPSQIVEMITILIGMLLLLQFERKGKFRGNLYACYLIFYGVTRFILNWFRYGVEPFALGLPAGNFWSIIAIILGIAWFIVMKNLNNRTSKGL
jgi:phosphatidylglycerol:prolipoprotein diacylglycerol transferase